MRIPIFRIFYSTTFTILVLLLIALVLITPGDHFRQSLDNNQIYNLIIVGAAYVITLIVAVIIYSRRLYATRIALQRIPRSWSYSGAWAHLGTGNAKRMTEEGVTQSAEIARRARPKPLRKGEGACWGKIEHPGWSPPEDTRLKHVQYATVIAELPHLVEAKSVAVLAQPPDPTAVELLHRPAAMGVRDYMGRLAQLGVVEKEAAAGFLEPYERARFGDREVGYAEFTAFMDLFARVLNSITPLDSDLLERFASSLSSSSSSRASTFTNDHDASSLLSGRRPSGASEASRSGAPEQALEQSRRLSSPDNAWRNSVPRTPPLRQMSMSRMERMQSHTSGSSVIRLVDEGEGSGLPYEFVNN